MSSDKQAKTVSSDTKLEAKDFSQSGIVTLLVGRKRKKFEIHKSILIAESDYFKAMFSTSSAWQESKSNEVVWPDESDWGGIEVIETWINWLYKQPLRTDLDADTLVDCYQLSYERALLSFGNAVIDAFRVLHNKNNWYCSPSNLIYLEERGLRGTPLYTLALRSWVFISLTRVDLLGQEHADAREGLRKAMAVTAVAQDYADAILEFRASPWFDPMHLTEVCCFHTHQNNVKCDRTTV